MLSMYLMFFVISSMPSDVAQFESMAIEDDDDDGMEEITKNIRYMESMHNALSDQGDDDTKGDVLQKDPMARMHRIMEKCRDSYITRAEMQQLQANNFNNPTTDSKELTALFLKHAQQGSRQRLPFLLSKPWVKEALEDMLQDERGHGVLLHAASIAN